MLRPHERSPRRKRNQKKRKGRVEIGSRDHLVGLPPCHHLAAGVEDDEEATRAGGSCKVGHGSCWNGHEETPGAKSDMATRTWAGTTVGVRDHEVGFSGGRTRGFPHAVCHVLTCP